MIIKPMVYNFLKDFTNYRIKTKRMGVSSCRPSLTFLNTETTVETFQQSGKQDFFRNILKSSASMYESSSSHSTWALEESKSVMNFLTNFGIREISTFRLVLQGKAGKEIPGPSRLEFQKKFTANNFALSSAEDNTSGPLNRGGIADLPFVKNSISNSPKFTRATFLGNDILFVLLA